MAHKVDVGQQFDDFSGLEKAIVHYQNAECVIRRITRTHQNTGTH